LIQEFSIHRFNELKINSMLAEEQIFKGITFTEISGYDEFDNCRFSNCNLTNADLSDCRFIECSFDECDLSNIKLLNTSLTETVFERCKMIGLQFIDCNKFLFTPQFSKCQLQMSSFYQMELRSFQFIDCNMQDVDFVETVLSGAIFKECDLGGAVFENTNLEKADLSNAFNFTMDPDQNHLKGAKFSINDLPGLLTKHGLKIVP